MPATRLKEFLDQERVRYLTIAHSPAFTAQEVAQAAHVPGKEMAKTVVVRLDGDLAMVVLPASSQLNLDLLKEATGAKRLDLASERHFRDAFPGCELGAMPPFGNLFGMPVYVSEDLTRDEEIAFNAGTHTEVIKMRYDDFEKLVKPRVVVL
jgi:Ala-tRNA(Pro) deacylase